MITPLDAWIRERAQINPDLMGRPYVEALESYQLQKLNEIIDYARRNTPFYRDRLASLALPLSALSEAARLPFTNPSDLSANPLRFLAVPQDDIVRIVTLRTSGSTGKAKRLFFTENDLELTVDFFHHGMSTMVRPGQKVAILLPCEARDSVGDLLARGLRRMDVKTLPYGVVRNPLDAASAIASFGADCLVGIPTHVLGIAHSRAGGAIVKGCIETVLLTTDYVPRAITKILEETWGCRVFNHYGMTEMGLGGGVECEALNGYHLREADLYFEVVDHNTGEVCPGGEVGEVVFTTLTRQGMPLIRYKTGDIARIIPEPCPCGTALRRMECVRGRWEGVVYVGSDRPLTLSDMDEALFGLTGLLDYRATVSRNKEGKRLLSVDVYRTEGGSITEEEVIRRLNDVEAIRESIARGAIGATIVRFSEEGRWITTGVAKRKIITESDLPAGPLLQQLNGND